MGGSASQRQTSEQTGTTTAAAPWQQAQNIDLLMQGARDFYNSGGPQYFPGQTYAGPTANELAGRAAATGYATGAGQDYINQVQQGEQFWLNPENIFNPQNIPGFAEAQAGITRDVTRNLTEGVLPELRSGNVAMGSLGGSRQEIGEGLAAARTGESIADALAGMNMGAYTQGLNMYSNAANRAPGIFNLGLAPAQVLQGVGGMERADTQQAIDADVQRFNFEQMAPFFNLEMLQQLIGTLGQYGSTISTSESGEARTSTDGGSGFQQLLGAGLSIASLFSHSSLKEEVVPMEHILPKLQNLDIFHWKYKGASQYHVGPMAEDFQRVFGVGDGITLNIFDLLGVLLGAVKELSLKGAN